VVFEIEVFVVLLQQQWRHFTMFGFIAISATKEHPTNFIRSGQEVNFKFKFI